jgi:flagellar assembly protein FliH
VDRGIDIEVLEEASFEKNQCVIETDGAVFDCSLNVEMDNLIKKIKMLSCMG